MNLHFLLVLLTSLLPQSFATSFYIQPFPEFVSSTPLIVRGVTSNIHATQNITPDGMKAIYTYATVDVKEVIQGSLSKSSIQVRYAGGTVDGYTVDVPSTPDLHDNEETVLFLGKEQEDQSYEVSGLELGKFELEERDGETYLKGGVFSYDEAPQKAWSLKALKQLTHNPSLQATPAQGTATAPAQTAPQDKSPAATPNKDIINVFKDPEQDSPLYTYIILGVVLAFIALFAITRKRKR